MERKLAIGMFSSGGVADLGFVRNDVKFIIHNELLHDRSALLKLNHPDSEVLIEDAWECYEKVISFSNKVIKKDELFLLFATPPCQGMSSNGAGTLLNNVRKGLRPKLDPRNRLIIPPLIVASILKPEWIVFENVPGMKNTMIEDENGKLVNILELVSRKLGNEYRGEAKVIEFADYGLPQRRKRLITVFTRNKLAKQALTDHISLIPIPSHDKDGKNGKKPWVTLREALSGFEKLDAKDKTNSQSKINPLHKVPVLDAKKYTWIMHTPENSTAFDNQCVNPNCRYNNNPKHGTARNNNGINQTKKSTPLYCVKCGSLLPRPYTNENGHLRIMSGYVSAYKRMSWDMPSSTLTTNFIYSCSDNKIHPSENRTLSFLEASKLQSISDYDYKWGPIKIKNNVYKLAPDTLIKDVIGESAPPMFFDKMCKWMIELSKSTTVKNRGLLQYVS